jgi:uncharacterized protein (DUF2141 family)
MLTLETFFDPNFYLETNPDVATALMLGNIKSPLEQFQKSGQFAGLDPTPLFDTQFYLEENPDVQEAVKAGNITAIEHFIKFGQLEGRNPSPLFDTALYLEQNPYIEDAILKDELTGIEHYVKFGRVEGLSMPIPDHGGNTLNKAQDFGLLDGTKTATDFVGDTDIRDIYRFVLDTSKDFKLTLDKMKSDADLRLVKDVNNNGEIDPGEIINISQKSGNSKELLRQVLQAGTYFAIVSQFDGNTTYHMNLSATNPTGLPPDNAGNTLKTSRDIGTLAGPQTFTDFVGSFDPIDIYRFNVDVTSKFSLIVDSLTGDFNVNLNQDINGNGQIENDEVLWSGTPGVTSQQIEGNLKPGTYFVAVTKSIGDTNYNIKLSATS